MTDSGKEWDKEQYERAVEKDDQTKELRKEIEDLLWEIGRFRAADLKGMSREGCERALEGIRIVHDHFYLTSELIKSKNKGKEHKATLGTFMQNQIKKAHEVCQCTVYVEHPLTH